GRGSWAAAPAVCTFAPRGGWLDFGTREAQSRDSGWWRSSRGRGPFPPASRTRRAAPGKGGGRVQPRRNNVFHSAFILAQRFIGVYRGRGPGGGGAAGAWYNERAHRRRRYVSGNRHQSVRPPRRLRRGGHQIGRASCRERV